MNATTHAAEVIMESSIKSPYAFMHSAVKPDINLTAKASLIDGIPDGVLALAAPVIAYWIESGFFHIIDTFKLLEQYRIHPSEAIEKMNQASRLHVLAEVIFQHIMQTAVGLAFLHFDGPSQTGFENAEMWSWRQSVPSYIPDVAVFYAYQYGLSALKIFLGFIFIDTWQFWLHYLMHASKTMYKNFHSVHHRLYVPYAYGALFNAPTEGLLLDTLGTGLAMTLVGLSHREEIILFVFATMKTVDDHCGYAIPADPFQWLFPNNAVYHDIHHQPFGLSYNFAQPFFTFWDTLLNTQYPEFKSYNKEQRRISIDKYKEFLSKRESEKLAKIEKLKKAQKEAEKVASSTSSK